MLHNSLLNLVSEFMSLSLIGIGYSRVALEELWLGNSLEWCACIIFRFCHPGRKL